ncbi:MAG: 5-methyltetrahydropteroyltriglutamate--homocysteine S-methyltransferase, partial [Acidimicrobiia bacterium]
MNQKPPFRADHVGSFLRPQSVLTARQAHEEGKVSDDELRAVEDEAISELVKKEEAVGLQGITDGEFRRTYFHIDFLEKLDGVNISYGEFFAKFKRDDGSEVGFRPPTMHVDSAIRHSRP